MHSGQIVAQSQLNANGALNDSRNAMVWQRPSRSSPGPTVWHTFQARDPRNRNEQVTYRVEDITQERYDDVIRLFTENFVVDEPLCDNQFLTYNRQAMEELDQFWRACLAQEMSIVCYKECSDEIIGADLLYVEQIEDEKVQDKFQNKAIRKIVTAHECMTTPITTFHRHGVEQYLTSYGLVVQRRYRRLGIAMGILQARTAICREFGIRVTAHNFTSVGSQKAAKKVGFKTDYQVSFDDFDKWGPGYKFPNIEPGSMDLMSLKVE